MLTIQPGPIRFPGMADAIGQAMDRQRAFSWVRGPYVGNVQMGVYLRHSQQTYMAHMDRLREAAFLRAWDRAYGPL